MLRLYLNLLGVLFEVMTRGMGRWREGVAPVCLSVKNFRLLFSFVKDTCVVSVRYFMCYAYKCHQLCLLYHCLGRGRGGEMG